MGLQASRIDRAAHQDASSEPQRRVELGKPECKRGGGTTDRSRTRQGSVCLWTAPRPFCTGPRPIRWWIQPRTARSPSRRWHRAKAGRLRWRANPPGEPFPTSRRLFIDRYCCRPTRDGCGKPTNQPLSGRSIRRRHAYRRTQNPSRNDAEQPRPSSKAFDGFPNVHTEPEPTIGAVAYPIHVLPRPDNQKREPNTSNSLAADRSDTRAASRAEQVSSRQLAPQ
jgi:hypothetical protein